MKKGIAGTGIEYMYGDLVGLTKILGWKDVSTRRQINNGTTIYRLPIKKYGQFIEVGSFESGYVRRMNGGYTPYQLNKCEPNIEFHKEYKWNDELSEQYWTGKYKKYVGKSRIKIMSTKKRLEYLITFCLKNYYINQANMIENGKFIPKWKHEWEMKNKGNKLQDENSDLYKEIEDLQIYQTKLLKKEMKYEKVIRELHEEIDRISENHDEMEGKFLEGQLQNLSVTVNGERYKII